MAPGISRVLDHTATKFQWLPRYFRDLFSIGTADVTGRRCVQEIQDGRQITGSMSNFAGFTDIHVVPKTNRALRLCRKHLNLQRSWPTLPRVENSRWQPTNRKY